MPMQSADSVQQQNRINCSCAAAQTAVEVLRMTLKFDVETISGNDDRRTVEPSKEILTAARDAQSFLTKYFDEQKDMMRLTSEVHESARNVSIARDNATIEQFEKHAKQTSGAPEAPDSDRSVIMVHRHRLPALTDDLIAGRCPWPDEIVLLEDPTEESPIQQESGGEPAKSE